MKHLILDMEVFNESNRIFAAEYRCSIYLFSNGIMAISNIRNWKITLKDLVNGIGQLTNIMKMCRYNIEVSMNNLYEYLVKEYNAHFSGWDFSYVNGRMVEDELPWDYRNIVENNLYGNDSLLDMDTGGGEFLLSLSNLPRNVYATEGYEPNIPIAEKQLKEKGIIFRPIKNDAEIPFDDKNFDVIINRHGSYKVNELKRTLRRDGLFITQQVGGLNGIDINMAFGTKTMDHVEWGLIQNMEYFKDAEMEIIDFGEYIGKMRFRDIGAFVYYLKCIPWQVQDFTVEKYYKKLEIMNDIIEKIGYISFIMHRFYIIVKNVS